MPHTTTSPAQPVRYVLERPFLDECGDVYVAAFGADGSCARLNSRAAAIWREIAYTGTLSADSAADPAVIDWIRTLIGQGLIREAWGAQ